LIRRGHSAADGRSARERPERADVGWVKAKVVVALTPGIEAAVGESADVVLIADWRDALPELLRAAVAD